MSKTSHIVNKRPIAFSEALRDDTNDEDVPSAITPEMLLHGRELMSLDLIPQLQPISSEDPTFSVTGCIEDEYRKLRDCNEKLHRVYHSEFLTKLIAQATDKPDRYKPVLHKCPSVGDVVLLVEPLLKQYNYPLGIVREVCTNSLGEATSVKVFKGNTREEVVRHVTSIIPILSSENKCSAVVNNEFAASDVTTTDTEALGSVSAHRQGRAAAVAADKMIRTLYSENSV